MQRQVDDAVAHHAAVVQQVGRRHEPVADVIREEARRRRFAGARDLALRAAGPTRRDRRRRRCRAPRPSSSHRSFACAIVFTHARSAAYIGCSGSIASGMPAGRAYSSSSPMPSRTISRAPGRSFDADAAVAILRQAADDEHEAARAERQRLVDGAPVVVERGAAARRGRPPGTCRRGSSRTRRGRRRGCAAPSPSGRPPPPGRARARCRGCRGARSPR